MAAAAIAPPLALSNGDVILIVVFVAIPVAAIAFVAEAGNALRQIGKGGLSVEFDRDLGRRRSRTRATAAARRGRTRTRSARCSRRRPTARAPAARSRWTSTSELERLTAEQAEAPSISDPALRDEVRQLVIARNERRVRQGKEPLDVEAEIERQLRELENLGQ